MYTWVLIHGGSAIAILNLLLFGVLLLLSTARDFFIGFRLIFKITVPSLHLIGVMRYFILYQFHIIPMREENGGAALRYGINP